MKKFIVKSALFLIPLLGLLIICEGYMHHVPNSYRQKDSWMKEHANEVEVLILGNSHGLFGLQPEAFPKKTYNLCQVSQTFEYDYYLLKRYAPSYQKLKDIILIVDNSNLFDVPLEQSEWFRCIYYRLYMDYPKHPLLSKYGFELSNLEVAIQKLKADKSACDSLGWNRRYTRQYRSADYLSEEAVSNAVKHHKCTDWSSAKRNREDLARIANWCKDKAIRLILVQAPVSKAYYEKTDFAQKDFIKKSCQIPGVMVLDYSHDNRFQDDDFYDADHLTTEGAEKWSKIISDSLF